MIRFVSGDVRLTILSAGTLWLDGGAMFGVVPKALWAKLRPPDERNRIRLGMNVLLVEHGTTPNIAPPSSQRVPAERIVNLRSPLTKRITAPPPPSG